MPTAQVEYAPISSSSEPDLFGFTGGDLEKDVKRYASGVLSRAIWEGYRQSGRALCIAATETGETALARICEFVRAGGELLVDSGAFMFRNNPGAMPWERVLAIYRSIADAADTRVTFILPDVVGSQQATLEALASWGNRVVDAVGHKHDLLLPVQHGDQSPAAFIKEAILCLKSPIQGLAIPSNAAAFPPSELAGLAHLPTATPHRVHFLGISRNSQGLQQRLLRLQEAWPDAEVSCDACEHRALVGQGKPITEARNSALEEMWNRELDQWDETEEDADAVRQLLKARYLHLDDDDIAAMLTSSWGAHVELQQKHSSHRQSNGPTATTESILAYATGKLSA